MLGIILFIHIVIALAIVALVLLQQGKGADMGAAFCSGSANTLFGSRGPASFLMKLTGGLVALFFVTSLSLGYLAHRNIAAEQTLSAPVAPKPVAQKEVAKPASMQKRLQALQAGQKPTSQNMNAPVSLKSTDVKSTYQAFSHKTTK